MDKKTIFKFINNLWQWIKTTKIPNQSDNAAWNSITDSASKLTAEYQGDKPMNKLFRAWVISYLDYMAEVSKEGEK